MTKTITASVDGEAQFDAGGGRTNLVFAWNLAVVGGPAALLGLLAWGRRWTSDDGFIFFRVVDQITHGNGPVFNAGERVETATSTVWTAILVAGRLVLPDAIELEEIALWLSLSFAVFGVVSCGLGARQLLRIANPGRADTAVLVPFGSLAVVGIAPFWDFSTSGLEMGLVFAWIGGSFWALSSFASCPAERQKGRLWPIAALIGLGALVRPDLAIFTGCFLIALLAVDSRGSWRHRLGTIGAALAIPAAYQVFRMGYYGSLVPNPAVAKGASKVDWGRGLNYLGNVVSSYRLWILLPLIGVGAGVLVHRLWNATETRRVVLVVAAPIVAAVLHATYIVRVGGDFMHARLLLPAIFALAAPVAVIQLRRSWTLGLAVLVVIWAAASSLFLTPLRSEFSGDQRLFFVQETHVANPVTLEDWRRMPWLGVARDFEEANAQEEGLLGIPPISTFLRTSDGRQISDVGRDLLLRPGVDADGAFAFPAVGAVSYALGTEVLIIDRLGLGDALAARIDGDLDELPTGHQRYLSLPWIEARYASRSTPDPEAIRRAAADFGRLALQCGELKALIDAIEDPLTPSRFAKNFFRSPSLTRLTVPENPQFAFAKFCR